MKAPADLLRLRLPATSANLGPGFDAVALALALFLEVEARASGRFSITATGRNADICEALGDNLILESYRLLWDRYARELGPAQPLALEIHNGIPLGMGCGSSAAARLAAVALVSHFAGLCWSRERMLSEASALENHPDNAAACCLGGFVVAGYGGATEAGALPVHALSIEPPAAWRALLVLPGQPLATTLSRGVLPEQYGRRDIVQNLQNTALLVAAFADGNAALLAAATRDCLHQPYRGEACPLLPQLLPLAGTGGILSVTLSGAGSGVLLLVESEGALPEAEARVRETACGVALAGEEASSQLAEILRCALQKSPAYLMPDGPS